MIEVIRLGRLPYGEAHARMSARLQARIEGRAADALLLTEHPPVFTLGRTRGADAHLLDPGDTPVVRVERGGDLTWHGPGQLVGYPILALPEGRRDLHAFLRGVEQLVIEVLAEAGLHGVRDPRNSGVWIGGRKVCAVGIACRRWVSWHGFALNLDPDLADFRRVEPCGMSAELVTRVADHLAPCPPMGWWEERFAARAPDWWARWCAGGGVA
jgi:lipoyl(octanoyl) transferase